MIQQFNLKFTTSPKLKYAAFIIALMNSFACDNKEVENKRTIIASLNQDPAGGGTGDSTITIKNKTSFLKAEVNLSLNEYTYNFVEPVVGVFLDSGLILEGAQSYSIYDTQSKQAIFSGNKVTSSYLSNEQIFRIFPYRESMNSAPGAWALADLQNITQPRLSDAQVIKVISTDSIASRGDGVPLALQRVEDLVPLLVRENLFWYKTPDSLVMLNLTDSTVRSSVIPISDASKFKILSIDYDGRILIQDNNKYKVYVYDSSSMGIKSYTLSSIPSLDGLRAVYLVHDGILFAAGKNSYYYSVSTAKWTGIVANLGAADTLFTRSSPYLFFAPNSSLNNFDGSHVKITVPNFADAKTIEGTVLVSAGISDQLLSIFETSCRSCHESTSESPAYNGNDEFNPLSLNHFKNMVQKLGKSSAKGTLRRMCNMNKASTCKADSEGETAVNAFIDSL